MLAVKLTSEGLGGIVRLSLQGTSAVVNQLDAISSGFRCKEQQCCEAHIFSLILV